MLGFSAYGDDGVAALIEAAEQGDMQAQRTVAEAFLSGSGGFMKNPAMAARYLKKLHLAGDPSAGFELAEMYRTGEAGRTDINQAIALYYYIAKRGHTVAFGRLQELGKAGFENANQALEAMGFVANRQMPQLGASMGALGAGEGVLVDTAGNVRRVRFSADAFSDVLSDAARNEMSGIVDGTIIVPVRLVFRVPYVFEERGQRGPRGGIVIRQGESIGLDPDGVSIRPDPNGIAVRLLGQAVNSGVRQTLTQTLTTSLPASIIHRVTIPKPTRIPVGTGTLTSGTTSGGLGGTSGTPLFVLAGQTLGITSEGVIISDIPPGILQQLDSNLTVEILDVLVFIVQTPGMEVNPGGGLGTGGDTDGSGGSGDPVDFNILFDYILDDNIGEIIDGIDDNPAYSL